MRIDLFARLFHFTPALLDFISHRPTLLVDVVWRVGEAAFKVQNGFDYTEGILRLQV